MPVHFAAAKQPHSAILRDLLDQSNAQFLTWCRFCLMKPPSLLFLWSDWSSIRACSCHCPGKVLLNSVSWFCLQLVITHGPCRESWPGNVPHGDENLMFLCLHGSTAQICSAARGSQFLAFLFTGLQTVFGFMGCIASTSPMSVNLFIPEKTPVVCV